MHQDVAATFYLCSGHHDAAWARLVYRIATTILCTQQPFGRKCDNNNISVILSFIKPHYKLDSGISYTTQGSMVVCKQNNIHCRLCLYISLSHVLICWVFCDCYIPVLWSETNTYYLLKYEFKKVFEELIESRYFTQLWNGASDNSLEKYWHAPFIVFINFTSVSRICRPNFIYNYVIVC